MPLRVARVMSFFAIWAGLLSPAATSQQAAQPAAAPDPEPYQHITNGGLNHTLNAYVVIGQPFAGQQVAKQGRTLTDGTNIMHFGHHAIYRDSAGRVRVEQPCGCAPDHEQIVEMYVMDPVAGTLTKWRTGGGSPKVATVTKWNPKSPDTVHLPQSRPLRALGPQITSEELPEQVIAGVRVRVVKVTTVVPANHSGNDRPITKTHTAWIADDLKVVVMEQWEDPRDGVKTVGLAPFERSEPNAALFQPPAGYQVQTTKPMNGINGLPQGRE